MNELEEKTQKKASPLPVVDKDESPRIERRHIKEPPAQITGESEQSSSTHPKRKVTQNAKPKEKEKQNKALVPAKRAYVRTK